MTKQVWVAIAVAGVLGTTALVATAGYKQADEVIVEGNYAYGTLGSARASMDSNQYIGCSSYGTDGWCSAVNASGTYKSCYWAGDAKAGQVQSIGPQTYIFFVVNTDGTCGTLFVSNYSLNLPSTP